MNNNGNLTNLSNISKKNGKNNPNNVPVKAKLTYNNSDFIKFQYNPTEIVFDVAVDLAESKGARHRETGSPKVNFSNFKPDKVTLKNIVYDTFEEGEDVVEKYINKYKEAVKFINGKDQPPILSFRWGNNQYLKRCFIQNLSYRLTMFLPDGTPVRAVIDSLVLVETDNTN